MKIALLDTHPATAQATRSILVQAGFSCVIHTARTTLLRALPEDGADAVLIAAALPDDAMADIVRQLRQMHAHLPILVIAAPNAIPPIREAFAAGADDCCALDAPDCLLARLVAHQQRHQREQALAPSVVELGPYLLDRSAGCAYLHGVHIALTPKQFAVAWLLFATPGEPVGRDRLEKIVWGHVRGPSSRALDVIVSRLRRDMQLTAENGARLAGVHSVGYCLYVDGAGTAPDDLPAPPCGLDGPVLITGARAPAWQAAASSH